MYTIYLKLIEMYSSLDSTKSTRYFHNQFCQYMNYLFNEKYFHSLLITVCQSLSSLGICHKTVNVIFAH